jgi:hypothetical protein
MAVGAITQCLKRYGEATLITALQCVTQTSNNEPGALSARTIKALCGALESGARGRGPRLAIPAPALGHRGLGPGGAVGVRRCGVAAAAAV